LKHINCLLNFLGLNVGLVHGKLINAEKARAMAGIFKAGELPVACRHYR